MSNDDMKLPHELLPHIRCPGRPSVALERRGDELVAKLPEGERAFPVLAGTPVLINEENSVFLLSDFEVGGGVTTMDLREAEVRLNSPVKRLKHFIGRLIPGKSRAVTDFSAHDAIRRIVAEVPDARILIVGAGDARFEAGVDACIVYSDVALAPDTHLIADCHDIPFADGTFDAVLAIAVLEHVADPFRCVAEMQRVLKKTGYIYAVTPFMQQVHMGRYDFTRFTSMGHRRLFRWFDELECGVANGPGMVIAWSLEYFFSTFSESPRARSLLRSLSRFIGWPFLLFDRGLARKRGANDCASAFYFFGRLRSEPISDREIVASYQGLN